MELWEIVKKERDDVVRVGVQRRILWDALCSELELRSEPCRIPLAIGKTARPALSPGYTGTVTTRQGKATVRARSVPFIASKKDWSAPSRAHQLTYWVDVVHPVTRNTVSTQVGHMQRPETWSLQALLTWVTSNGEAGFPAH